MTVEIREYRGTLQTMQLLDANNKTYRIQLGIGQDIVVLNNVKQKEINILKEDQ